MTTSPLLIELFTEELPPKNLQALSSAFADSIIVGLQKARLLSDEGDTINAIRRYATPRRLAVLLPSVSAIEGDQWVEKKGPAVASAFAADGNPTKALEGFARGAGVAVSSLTKAMDGAREVMVAKVLQKGQSIDEALPLILDQAIKSLPVAKNMRWGNLTESFVRPVHGITLLHGERVIPYSRFGVTSNRITSGHRFLGEKAINIPHANDYENLLSTKGAVVASFADRQQTIMGLLEGAVKAINPTYRFEGGEALVSEVAALVELPHIIVGQFGEAFLSVPQEALMVSMMQHQKYFPVLDGAGKITSHFLLVANMPPTPDSPNTIKNGNERVLRARLSDAKFFFDTDRKEKLSTRTPKLSSVTYLQALADKAGKGGSQLDRVQRMGDLAKTLSAFFPAINAEDIHRAVMLCKADLITGMVGEFPELQGVMGEHYAMHDGEKVEVAVAIREHYLPRFSGDTLPATPLGQILAMADKWESLAGLFGIGKPPTGDKDPFGLRRAALGLLRMMVELRLPVNLSTLYDSLPTAFANTAWQPCQETLHAFMMDRLRFYLRDRGFSPDIVEALVANHPKVLSDIEVRLNALQSFMANEHACTLIAMGKRIRNILKPKADGAMPATPNQTINVALLTEPAEKALHQAVEKVGLSIYNHLQKGEFTEALQSAVSLSLPLTAFFDGVMVMADDMNIRTNRLALLASIDGLINGVGAIGELRA